MSVRLYDRRGDLPVCTPPITQRLLRWSPATYYSKNPNLKSSSELECTVLSLKTCRLKYRFLPSESKTLIKSKTLIVLKSKHLCFKVSFLVVTWLPSTFSRAFILQMGKAELQFQASLKTSFLPHYVSHSAEHQVKYRSKRPSIKVTQEPFHIFFFGGGIF